MKILILILILSFTGCATIGNRTSTFTYDPTLHIATFDGRTDEKATCKLPDGTEIMFDRTGGEGILEKVLGVLAIMPRMDVRAD